MNAETFFTKAFGIAPLTKMPRGVQIASISLGKRPENALKVLRRAHPSLDKPYWPLSSTHLLVVVERDAGRLKTAMKETYPQPEVNQYG